MNIANYMIMEETDDYILIKDLGPWDRFQTITKVPNFGPVE